MSTKTENSSFSFPLWWSGVFLGVLAAVAIQLAGLPLSHFSFSEVSDQKNCEALNAVLSESLPLSRQIRSSRSRNGVHGRLNVRCGSDGNSECLWTEAHLASFRISGHLLFIPFANSKNFWIDYIISALPVRAGPRSIKIS